MKPTARLRLFLLGSILLAAPEVDAAIYYWDNNNNTAGFGNAAGTWASPTTNNASQGWTTNSGGTASLSGTTTTGTGDSINFGNGATGLVAGTIAVSGTVNSGDITFASGSGVITLSGGTINLAGTSTITVNNSFDVINSILSGAATSLTKAGNGTLILSGANTYTGATNITAGTLVARSGSALGTGTGADVSVATNTGLVYNAGSNTQLAIDSLSVTGGASTVIGTSIGTTATSAAINVAGDATTTAAAVKVNIYGVNGVTHGTGTMTLIDAVGGGSTLNNATYTLGAVYNNTDFTVGALSATTNKLEVATSVATALTSAYWKGGLGLGNNVWAISNGSTQSNWVSTLGGSDQALVPGSGTDVFIANSTVTTAPTGTVLGSDMSIKSLTISHSASAFALNSDGYSLTIGSGGITKAAGSGTQTATINSRVVLGTSQTWTNDTTGAGTLTATGGVDLNGNTLTFAGSGNINFHSTANKITGGGGIIMNGSGLITLAAGGTNPGHDYTGTTVINNGTVMIAGASKSTGNFTLNGGMLTDYFQSTTTFTGLGAGNGQIQIYGDSGFGGGNGTSIWRIGASGSVLQWGSTYFDPTTLKFLAPGADNLGPTTYGAVTLDNGINLNGAARTISVAPATGGSPLTSSATISGVVSGTGSSSLIKTGGGHLILSNAANTYVGSTTISAGTLSANGSGALGNGSATNTLIFNGGTLRATGTITSVATRSVTMTSTGIIDNNGQSISIAGNIGGAGGLTKNSTGTLTLSGTNSYGGVTTINAGTLVITKQLALYNNTPLSWTAANINMKFGTTLALNVDSGGSAGFTSGNLDTLLGNISVANSAAQGLQHGVTLTLDTATATGATFTQGNAITDSTGVNGGLINLTKIGAGTLVLDETNTYSGATTITVGTVNANASAALGDSSVTNTLILNGGTLQAAGTITSVAARGVTVAAASTIDTNSNSVSIAGNMIGSGNLTKSGAGTLTLSNVNANTGSTTVSAGTLTLSDALALQTSALVTTGAGTVTLSGVTAPTIGGLSGASGNLSAIISNYNTVTGLTLNPQSGSVTYGGIIANSDTNVTLTKTGAGTQILSNTGNSYTGLTTISGGTLQITGRLNTTVGTALTFGGSGVFNVNEAASSTQGMGALTFSKGEGSILSTAAGATSMATLTFASMAARTAGATGNFSLVTNLTASQNKIVLSDTTNAPVNGSGSNNQGFFFGGTEYARYDTTAGYFRAVTYGADNNASALVGTGATLGIDDATKDVKITGAITGQTTAAVNTLNLGANNFTFSNAANIFSVNGILSTGTAAISNTTTASKIQATAAGGEIVIRVNGASDVLTIAPVIRNFGVDSGGTASALVKTGAGTLILNGANYTYTGDTYVNAGILQFGVGTSGGTSVQLNGGSYAGNIFIGAGAALSFQGNATNTLGGIISGAGNLNLNRGTTIISHNNNTYTGKTTLTLVGTNATGSTLSVSSFNSVFTNAALGTVHSPSSSLGAPTTVANGTIDFGGGGIQQSAQINYTGSGETTDRIINFQFNGNGANRTIDAGAGGGLLKFTSTPTSNGATGNNIVLQGTSNGEFAGGLPFGFTNLTKGGTGTWTLGGAVGSTGVLTINANSGTLALQKSSSLMSGNTANWTAAKVIVNSGSTLAVNVGGAGEFTNSDVTTLLTNLGGLGGAVNNNGLRSGSKIGFDTTNAAGGTFTITNNIANSTGTGGGAIGLTKLGTGKLELTGTNSYTGATTVSAGTLIVNGNISTSSLTTVSSGATLGGSGTVGDLTIATGGFFSPGNSPGITTVDGNYIQNGELKVEIEGLTAGNGSGLGYHDQVVVNNGTVSLTGALNILTFTGFTPAPNDLIFILLNDGIDTISGTFSGFAQGDVVGNYLGKDWKISYNADSSANTFTGTPNGNDIALMAVPEPRAALLGGLGLLMLLRRRR